jgi:hypothetical protein
MGTEVIAGLKAGKKPSWWLGAQAQHTTSRGPQARTTTSPCINVAPEIVAPAFADRPPRAEAVPAAVTSNTDVVPT